jgi:hypothetical protein
MAKSGKSSPRPASNQPAQRAAANTYAAQAQGEISASEAQQRAQAAALGPVLGQTRLVPFDNVAYSAQQQAALKKPGE